MQTSTITRQQVINVRKSRKHEKKSLDFACDLNTRIRQSARHNFVRATIMRIEALNDYLILDEDLQLHNPFSKKFEIFSLDEKITVGRKNRKSVSSALYFGLVTRLRQKRSFNVPQHFSSVTFINGKPSSLSNWEKLIAQSPKMPLFIKHDEHVNLSDRKVIAGKSGVG